MSWTTRSVSSLLICALGTSAASADNLVFNGGFELGQAGFELVKYLRYENNPKMLYEGAVAEEAGAVSGKRCLRIPNRFGEAIELYAREVRLKPATEYTVSVQLRSGRADTPVQVCFTSITPKSWKGPTVNAVVGTTWQQVSRTFRTEGDPKQEYALRLAACWKQDDPGADLWVDEFQVIEGGAQAFRPAAQVELAILPDKSLAVLDGPAGTAPATLAVINHGTTPVRGNVALRLAGSGPAVAAGAIHIELAPGEEKRLVQQVAVPRFGAFNVEAVPEFDAPAAVFAAPLTAVGRYAGKPIDFDTTFCVGVNAGIGLEVNPNWDSQHKRSFKAENAGPEDYMAMLGAMGCRLARSWDSGDTFTWQALERTEGAFDFSYADMVVGICTRNGITPFPVLGGDAFLCPRNGATHRGWPTWLRPKCQVREDVDEWLKQRGEALYLPPMELWRTYIRTIATRYKGVIRHVEILNEPNLYLRPKEYVPYLAAAYEELHQVDGKMQVVGFCTTGDLGAQLGAFLEQCFALGGLKSVDGVSFHPYDGKDLSSPTPADKQIAGIRALAAKGGRPDVPLWNTELYYLAEGVDGQGAVRAEHIARRFLTDLGEGLRQSTPAHIDSLWRMTLNPSFGHPVVSSRWVPSDNFVAYNALARTFEGAKPLAKHLWGSDTVCYVYEREGRTLAACWNYGTADGLRVVLPTPAADLRVLDVLGNRLPAGPLQLTGSPLFLLYEGKDRSGFAATLKAATLDVAKPLDLGPARLVPLADGWAVAAGIRNLISKEMQVSAGISAETVVAASAVTAILPGLGDTSLLIPVSLRGAPPAKLPMKLFSAGRMWDLTTPLEPAGKSVAVTTAAGAEQAITLAKPGTTAKHQARFTASRDAQGLRLLVTVQDATPSGAAGTRKPWEQDCIELFFDPTPAVMPAKQPEAYHERMLRLFILPHVAKDQQVTAWISSGKPATVPVDCTVKTSASGYTAEIVLPFATLGLDASAPSIGFEIAVDDADGTAKGSSQLGWNSAIDANRNRFRFGFLTFP